MECNKDEAIRAKEIAEKKMQSNDFEGARKIALKAKNLYPELENIIQILSICDVHCSSQITLSGFEKDWYAVLQVEKLADEATVKKQYRRLALNLHPDKNRFPGAEGAFKLICEANAILSDPAKKSAYDNKIRVLARSVSANPPNHNLNSSQLNRQYSAQGIHTSNVSSRDNQHQVPQSTFAVFWTCCPSCNARYQYERRFINRTLQCPRCRNNFVTYEVSAPSVPAKLDVHKRMTQNAKVPPATHAGSQATANSKIVQNECGSESIKVGSSLHGGKVGVTFNGDASARVPVPRHTESKSQKRMKKSDNDVENQTKQENLGDAATKRESKATHARFSHRSSGGKQPVSCKETDEDDCPRPLKRAQTTKETNVNEQKAGTSSAAADAVEVENDSDLDSSSSKSSEARCLECPDPDFSDFDKLRDENNFRVGQFWTCYDETFDGMPRYYAKVVKVSASPFELQFKWLEAVPISSAYKRWVDEELPVGCGSFKLLGKPEKVSGSLSFSHQVHCEMAKKKGPFFIYPRKGEVWALFRDWDISWSSNPDDHKGFKYEVVELLSDYAAETGIEVCYLNKVSGFVSLFQRASETNSFVIVAADLYKFSHCVPSFEMSGSEREGVPIGSFELDPAALPLNPDDLYFPSKAKIK